jgi:hypothetical protein
MYRKQLETMLNSNPAGAIKIIEHARINTALKRKPFSNTNPFFFSPNQLQNN